MLLATAARPAVAPHPPVLHGRPVVEAATVVVGAALAVVVGHDGSPSWQVTRVVGALAATAACLRLAARGRRALRGATAVLAGVVGVVVGGGIGVWHLTHDTLGVAGVAGLVSLVAGVLLLVAGSGLLLRAARGWRKLLALPIALAVSLLVVYPLTLAVAATNARAVPLGERTPHDLGLAYSDVTFETADGVELSGWYLTSRTRAAVVLLHGASSTRANVLEEARVLADAGYGVLLYDARGHGRSGGRAMELGWYGDLDIAAAVDFLAERPDVDPARIGAIGLSMGGEQAIGAAATDSRIRAVVSEGGTGRVRADKGWLPTHLLGQVQRAIDAVTYGAADLLTSAGPPIALRDAVRQAAPTPVLLIAGGAVPADAETDAMTWIRSGSPGTVELWVVPDAGHTDGLATAPDEWSVRVREHLRRALLDR